jgi:hypothetical protein
MEVTIVDPFEEAKKAAAKEAKQSSASDVKQIAANKLRTAAMPAKKMATIWNTDTGKKMQVELDDKGKMLESEKTKISETIGDKWSLWTGGKASGEAAREKIRSTAAATLRSATPDTNIWTKGTITYDPKKYGVISDQDLTNQGFTKK